jgi:hypothetical protein
VANGNQLLATFNGKKYWFEALPGCTDAVFDVLNENKYFCNVCQGPDYSKPYPTSPLCLNQQAGSSFMSPNKQCTPADTGCDSRLAIWSAAKYAFFELGFSGTQVEIRFKKEWDFLFLMEMRSYAVYETISATKKRVFCKLISDNLDDDQTLCTWIRTGDYTKIVLDVSSEIYRRIIASTSTAFVILKKAPFVIKRKYIQDAAVLNVDLTDPAAFNPPIDFFLDLTFNTAGFKESIWTPVYQPFAVMNQPLNLNVGAKDWRLSLLSYEWTCISITGETTSDLRKSFNASLQTFKNAALQLNLTDTRLQGKTLVMLLKLKDEFFQEYYHIFEMQVVTPPRALEPFLNEPLLYSDGNQEVFVPLKPNIQNLNESLVTLTTTGLTGTLTSSLTKRYNYFVLQLKVDVGNDFNVTLTYGTYTPTVLQFFRVKSRVQSYIFHEDKATNDAPFIFQLINRGANFKVYCADDTNRQSCLPGWTTSSYTPGDRVTMASPFSFAGAANEAKTLFFMTTIGSDTSIASSRVTAIVSPPGQTVSTTPKVATRATIAYPESPFFASNEVTYYDFTPSAVSYGASVAAPYIDTNMDKQSTTLTFANDGYSQYSINQAAAVSSFKLTTGYSATLSGTDQHSFFESRIAPIVASSSLTVAQTSNNGIVDLTFAVTTANRGTCNDPLSFFTTQLVFDGKVIVSDVGQVACYSLIPKIFGSQAINVQARTSTYCGQVVSNTVAFLDSTGLTFTSTLASYVGNSLVSLGTSVSEQVNGLNLVMLQLWKGYARCIQNSGCIATPVDFMTQAEIVLSKIPTTLEQNKYALTSRYSLINSFMWEPKIMTDPAVNNLLMTMFNTSEYLKTKARPILYANPRLSRELRKSLSDLNLIQTETVDVPIRMATNMLSVLLFQYVNNTDRGYLLNYSITDIVNYAEFKQLRVSSNKRKEYYEDESACLSAMTVLTPLEPSISIELSNTKKLVFKNLAFENTSEYYEIIVLGWKPALVEKIEKYYNKSNQAVWEHFYYEFRTYFRSEIPIAGEGQILGTDCQQKAECSPSTEAGYNVCTCVQLNASVPFFPKPDTYTLEPKPYVPINVNTTQPPGNTTDPPKKDGDSSLAKDAKELFDNPNANKLDFTTVNNFSTWCYSTLGIFFIFFVLYGLGIFNSGKLKSWSVGFAMNVSMKLFIHQLMLQEESTHKKKTDEERNDSCDFDAEDAFSKPSHLGTHSSNQNLTEDQKNVISRLKRMKEDQDRKSSMLPEIEMIDLKVAEKCGYKKLTPLFLYFLYLMMNHPITSILFLKSEQYSKVIMLSLTYIRMMAHLALSMYFTLGKPE